MFERQDEMAPGLVAGTLEGISVPDLMWSLCRGQADGVLRVSREGVRKTLYLEQGRIVFAASSDPDDRLGELLLRKGWVLLDQLEAALGSLASGKRLGTILVEAGHLSPENLVNGVLTQVREISMDLFTWETGQYAFEPGPLPTQEVITLDIGTGELLLQGIRRIRSFSRIRRSVGRPRTVYRLRPDGRELVEGLSLTSGEEQLLSRLEGGAESIETLCQDVYLSNFEVYQALWALKVLGAVEVEDRPGTIVDDAAVAGRFGAETIAPVLVRLCRSGETGVLYVSRGSLERTMHVRNGQVVFATSNDIDDGLVAYLLRRGVISLRDREETAKRLLSNKRVGTILRDMGVIDELDLRNMVREHLCEILHDTVSWASGEYAFVPGELPTVEEITLDVTIESLIAAGLHRITSWSRVRDGIGGIHQRLELSPDFLSVLDRMSIGPAEWEVVTSLKEPRTAMEVCRQTGLGDFRVTQILWSLRMLGAVTQADESAVSADEFSTEIMMPAAMALDDHAPDPVVAASDTVAQQHEAADDDSDREEGETPPTETVGGAWAASPEDREEVAGDEDVVQHQPAMDPPEFELAEPGSLPDEPGVDQGGLSDDPDREPRTFEVARPGEGSIDAGGSETWLTEAPREDAVPSFEVGPPGAGPSEDEAAAAWLPPDTPETFELGDPGMVAVDEQAASEDAPQEDRCSSEDPVDESVLVLTEAHVESVEDRADPDDASHDDHFASDSDVDGTAAVDDFDGGSWSRRRESDAEPGWAARGPQNPADHDLSPGDDTRILSRDEVDAALGREPSPDVTQAIDPELVRRVLAGTPDGAAGAFSVPDDASDADATEPVEETASGLMGEDDPVAAESFEAVAEPSETASDDVDVSAPFEAVAEPSEAAPEDAEVSAPPEAVAEPSEAASDDVEVTAPLADDGEEGVDRLVEAADDDGKSHDPWTPPEDLESTIARFNARQRVLYRTIRAEIGAGAVNFIRSCCGKVGSSPADPFEGVDLRNDGTWDVDGLRQVAIEQRLEDPWTEYERLLELEFDLLKIQIGDARAQALREQMDRAAVQPARGSAI